LLIDQYGDEAHLEAIDNATLMVGRGDISGQWTWLRIFEAVGELQETNMRERA
jgi:hypothetical protein